MARSPATFDAEVRQALDNVKAIVESAGLTMEHVVYTQVYLEDISKYDEMNRVFAEYFAKTPPARAVLGVAGVPEAAHSDQRGRGAQFRPKSAAVYPPNYKSERSPLRRASSLMTGFSSPACRGSDPVSGKVPDDPAAQVDLALDRLQAVAKAAGPRSQPHGLRQSIPDCGNPDACHEPALRTAL